MIERRFSDSMVELRGEDDQKIGGIASVYYDPSDDGTQFRLWEDTYERIMPGAFDRAIEEDDVRALFNHDSNLVLGRNRAGTLTLRSGSRGLEYEVTPGETTAHRDVMEYLRRGDVTGSSFGFRVREHGEEWRKEGGLTIREITDVELFDVSPVTFPAYESSTSELRSLEGFKKLQSTLIDRDGLARQIKLDSILRSAKLQAMTT